jgi:ribosomal protein S18 acetylase RimI-like enzyme
LKKVQGGKIRVDVAIDEVSDEKVSYCVSPVGISRVGEIESIYVEVNYRGRGIGDTLIRKGIGWIDAKCAESKIVESVLVTKMPLVSMFDTVLFQGKQC